MASQWPWSPQSMSSLERVDSPLAIGHGIPAFETQNQAVEKDCSPIARRSTSISQRKRSYGVDGGAGVRFVTVSHPDQLKDREQMRKNRTHVMHNYLDKERLKPDSRDTRVSGAGQPRKRKRRVDAPSPGITKNPAAPSNIFCCGLSRSSVDSSSVQNQSGSDIHRSNTDSGASTSPSDGTQRTPATRTVVPRTSKEVLNRPLVPGISGRFRNYTYLGASLDEIPWTPSSHQGGLGSELNPFDTWPAFSDPRIRVNELKWSCSRRFGSKGMAAYWVPELFKARHAFLSTMCISSAHDDIMRRAFKPPEERPVEESYERVRVRTEVTSMINASMRDPQMQTADATLVAVLHLLNAELMGRDDDVMRVHQGGLHAMIKLRGGLGQLGVHGELAAITTTTMYMIACLRETLPHADFINFAEKLRRKPSQDSRVLPESPVYCKPTGYQSLTKVTPPGSRIYSALETNRKLTKAFAAQHSPSRSRSNPNSNITAEIDHLTTTIFALPPATDLDFPSMPERYTYESIRLTSRIYAHSLANTIPFSASALQLQGDSPPMHILIRDALMRTDTTDCWGHMAGVLFWIGLVAGAAGNPAGGYVARRTGGDEEDARKFLAAVVVRVSVVLGFEFGEVVLGSVGRVVGIQDVLRRGCGEFGEEELGAEVPAAWALATPTEAVVSMYGPSEPPAAAKVQRGFADFAEDFLSV